MIWVLVAPVVAWVAIRTLRLDAGFPLVSLMAFTAYAAIAAFFVAGLAAALENWVAAAVAALATLLLALAVLPRAIGDGTVSAAGRQTLTVVSVNIHHGTADPEAVLALVRRYDPDVLSVQELTPGFARKLDRAGLSGFLPNRIVQAQRGASGAGLYSRLGLRELPSPPRLAFRMPRARLRLPDGGAVRLVGVHPYPPTSSHADEWEAALGSLPSTGDGAPWVLAGDFNAGFDQAAFADLVDRGFRDAGAVAGAGLEPTWPAGAWASRLPPITIDHVLLDRRLDVVDYGVEDLPGSDHRALHAVLALP